MAQVSKPGADQAVDDTKATTDRVAAQGRRAADQVGDVAREATERGEDAARQGLRLVERAGEVQHEVARRSAEETAELGRVLVALTVAQTRQNLETLKALTDAVDWAQVSRAVDWRKVLEIQNEHVRVSLERTAELGRRYLELGQAVFAATASAAERQAKRAA